MYFDRFSTLAQEAFATGRDLVCIMACGIVVRGIAPLLRSKDRDPAVVAVDEYGRYAVSLVSGHIGGANALARAVSRITGGEPVITTATDLEGLPAIDVLALESGMRIEDTGRIKDVHMALIKGRPIGLVDETGLFKEMLAPFVEAGKVQVRDLGHRGLSACVASPPRFPVVYAGNRLPEGGWPPNWLALRPRDLVAGIGCNREASAVEILELLHSALERAGLSILSVGVVASIGMKKHERGLVEAIEALEAEARWFSPEELRDVEVPTPSQAVKRHVGTPSVCEAAAVLGAKGGRLLVQKTKGANVTVAVARAASL